MSKIRGKAAQALVDAQAKPTKAQGGTEAVKANSREIRALWQAFSLLQADLNKLKEALDER